MDDFSIGKLREHFLFVNSKIPELNNEAATGSAAMIQARALINIAASLEGIHAIMFRQSAHLTYEEIEHEVS